MTEEKQDHPERSDRPAIARAVRRRLADHRIAADLRTRGWTVTAPTDDLEKRVRHTALTSRTARTA